MAGKRSTQPARGAGNNDMLMSSGGHENYAGALRHQRALAWSLMRRTRPSVTVTMCSSDSTMLPEVR